MPNDIVLLHGAALSGRMWDPARAILCPEFTVHTPDLPGHGIGRQRPFSLDEAVNQVAQLIQRVGPAGAVVAGDSLGGYTAMALAANHPRLVRGLVLGGCTSEFIGWTGLKAWAAGHLTLLLAKLVGEERLVARTLKQVPKVFPNAPLDAIAAGGLKLEARGEALIDLAGRRFFGPLTRFDSPILAVNGEHDQPNRRGEADFLRAVPAARLEVFQGSPHGVSLAEPKRFADLIRDFARAISK